MMKPHFSVLVTHTQDMHIVDHQGLLPWDTILNGILERMFIETKIEPVLITGVNTIRSMSKQPQNVHCIVLSTHKDAKERYALPSEVEIYPSLSDALVSLLPEDNRQIFVSGGCKLIEEALNHPCCNKIISNIVVSDKIFGRNLVYKLPPFDLKKFYIAQATFLEKSSEGAESRSVCYYSKN